MNLRAQEAMEILYEDSDEEEITFRTPPNSVKSSKLKSGASTGANPTANKYKDAKETDTPVTTVTDKKSKTSLRKRKTTADDEEEDVSETQIKEKTKRKTPLKTPKSKKKKQ